MKPRRYEKRPLPIVSPASGILLALILATVLSVILGIDWGYRYDKTVSLPSGHTTFIFRFVWPKTVLLNHLTISPNLMLCAAGLAALHLRKCRKYWMFSIVWVLLCLLWSPIVEDLIRFPLIYFAPAWYVDKAFLLFNGCLAGTGVVLAALLLTAITRSKLVMGGWVVAVLVFGLRWINSSTPMNSWRIPINVYDGHYNIHASTIVFHLATIIPLLLWAILERRKPIPESLCPNCDYDLVGLSENSPCPECGKAPTTENL